MELNKYEVIDNFLDKDYYNNLKTFLYGTNVNWFIREQDTENSKNKNGYFSFCWYNDWRINHPLFYEHTEFMLKKLNCFIPIQVRANLTFRDVDTNESGWHTDYNISASTTAILYFTKSNAKTVLNINNKPIEIHNIENRLLKFNTTTKHKIVYQTDVHKRIVMNLNYIEQENGNN